MQDDVRWPSQEPPEASLQPSLLCRRLCWSQQCACLYNEFSLLPPFQQSASIFKSPAVNPCSLVSHQPDVLHIKFAEDRIPMNATTLHRWQSFQAGCCCCAGRFGWWPRQQKFMLWDFLKQ